jgi:hypothetical protein
MVGNWGKHETMFPAGFLAHQILGFAGPQIETIFVFP